LKVLLTGATGFIGGHVAWSLLQRGYEVVALVRPASTMTWRHDSLEVRAGDVRDADSVRAAMVGCEGVIHAAAQYSLWSRDPGLIYDVNVQGTRNVLRAAVDAGVARIVHTSTVGTVRFRKDTPATEADVALPRGMTGHYKRSKYEAERLALRMAATGAPIVVVNPTAPVGAADVKPTPTGVILVDFLRGRLPAVLDTGLNFVHVRDVVQRMAKITGLPAPRWRIPHAVARVLGSVDGLVEGSLLHREPRIPTEGVRMAHVKMWVDPSKAIRELGMPQSPLHDALTRAVAWYATHGYAPMPPSAVPKANRGQARQRQPRNRVR